MAFRVVPFGLLLAPRQKELLDVRLLRIRSNGLDHILALPVLNDRPDEGKCEFRIAVDDVVGGNTEQLDLGSSVIELPQLDLLYVLRDH